MSTTNTEDAMRRGSGGYVTSDSDLREAIAPLRRMDIGHKIADAAWNEALDAVMPVFVAYLREHAAHKSRQLADALDAERETTIAGIRQRIEALPHYHQRARDHERMLYQSEVLEALGE